jgi:hypothetical protein
VASTGKKVDSGNAVFVTVLIKIIVITDPPPISGPNNL